MKTKRLLLLQACIMLFAFSAMAATTYYQAEDKTAGLNAAVATDQTGYHGTGFVQMTNVAGNYFEWNNIASATAMDATIRFRYTNSDAQGRNRDVEVIVNGTSIGIYLMPTTGGWNVWSTPSTSMTIPLNAGNNTVRVKINNAANSSPKIDEMEVVIGAPTIVNVASVKVDPSNFGIFVSKTATLKAVVLPENATNKSVAWASDNTNVAGIDANSGFLTAIAEGIANVTATSTDGNIVGTCTVKVYPLTATSSSSNLILNPGFEDAIPTTNWSTWGNFTTTTSPVATGVNAGTVTNALAGGFAQDVTIPVGSAGKTYLFSVKVATANAPTGAQTGCELYEGAQKLNSPYYVTSTDATFTTYNWIVATTAATTIAKIWVYKSAAGTIYTDDYRFSEIDATPTSLNKNSAAQTFCSFNANQLMVKNSAGLQSVSVYNANGQFVVNKVVNNEAANLNVSSLSNGIYIVKATLKSGQTEFIKVLK